MQTTMIDIINNYGYLGVFLLILLENLFPPIPSEVVLLFGGAMTVGTAMSAPMVIFVATLGSLFGTTALYLLGRILKTQRLKKLFAGRFGKILRLKPEYVDRASGWFQRYQNRAVLICRCIPIMRSLISIPAGVNEMNVPLFLALTAIGSAIWNTVMVLLGVFLGSTWQTALPLINRYSAVVAAVFCLAFLAYVVYKIKNLRARRKPKDR